MNIHPFPADEKESAVLVALAALGSIKPEKSEAALLTWTSVQPG